MIRLYKTDSPNDEARLQTEYPEALLYARAEIATKTLGQRDMLFKDATVSRHGNAWKAFIVFSDEQGLIKVQIQKTDEKCSVTKYLDEPHG